jgi:sugar/nucleoside kinase (ribokinase family)
MLVVGGTYLERCVTPDRNVVAGSGMRAAAILRGADPDLQLVSAVSDLDRDAYESAANAYGVDVSWLDRTSPIAFDYFTPLSTPAITGRNARIRADPEHVNSEAALAFGMIEGAPPLRARRAVFDPQQPRELAGLELGGITAESVAVVLNSAETAAVSGTSDPWEGGRIILESGGVDVVITKRAMRGALVTTAEGQRTVSPRRTRSVWPIGSGDAFAAGFAWAWAERGLDPFESAEIASRVAGRWCSTSSFEIPAEVLAGDDHVGESIPVNDARVYLAGPFFTVAERWLIDLCRSALGPHVFSPLHDVGVKGPGDPASDTAVADLEGLKECDSVLALIDRSDPGTIFETGWATAAGIGVVAYGEMLEQSAITMIEGSGSTIVRDLSTAVYLAVWAAMTRAAQRT